MSDITEDAEANDLRREVAAVPAMFIDSFYLNAWPGHLRITLGEWLGGKSNFRQAIVMEANDAERLAKDILDLVEEAKQNQSADGTPAAVEPTRAIG